MMYKVFPFDVLASPKFSPVSSSFATTLFPFIFIL